MLLLEIVAGCQSQQAINSFEDCVNAGNPVMESYPRQCSHKGQTFVEEIPPETNSEAINYVSEDPDECSRIRFLCEPSYEPFSDDSGCGCRKKVEESNSEQQFCTPESRQADACIELYDLVCGWNDPEKIQCIKYPCAQTFSNRCFACMDEKVLYWTEGECPG